MVQIAYNNQKLKTITKNSKPGEREESDFQGYHITKFKYPMSNKKKHKIYKEAGQYGHKEKKINKHCS